jgi:hypothetical protein
MNQGSNNSGKLKLTPSTSKPSVVRSPQLQLKRPSRANPTHTLVEKYNLETMCWRLFWTTTQSIDELTNILNNNLAQKETALKKQNLLHPNQYLSRLVDKDVVEFLDKYKRKIEVTLGNRESQLMDQTFDIIEQIQRTAMNVMETMEMWQSKLSDARGKDDLKEMVITSKMLSGERKSLVDYIQKLAELTGKVKTHISVNVLQENVQIICEIIGNSEVLDENQKLTLLSQVQQSITLSITKSVDE